MAGYIGLGAVCTFRNGHREILVIGFKSVEERHTLSHVGIEEIVNRFDFDKSKIHPIVCDQG